jgi:hypothetical protein
VGGAWEVEWREVGFEGCRVEEGGVEGMGSGAWVGRRGWVCRGGGGGVVVEGMDGGAASGEWMVAGCGGVVVWEHHTIQPKPSPTHAISRSNPLHPHSPLTKPNRLRPIHTSHKHPRTQSVNHISPCTSQK